MKKVTIMIMLAIAMLATTCYAAEQASGNALVNGASAVVKMPVKMLEKASDSLDKGPTVYSEDDVTSPIFNMDSETSG